MFLANDGPAAALNCLFAGLGNGRLKAAVTRQDVGTATSPWCWCGQRQVIRVSKCGPSNAPSVAETKSLRQLVSDPAAYLEDRRRVLAAIEMCMHQRYSRQLRVKN
jgi:hypothetical protein